MVGWVGAGRFRRLPELELGPGYRHQEAQLWVSKIKSARLRTMTLDRVHVIEQGAGVAAASRHATRTALGESQVIGENAEG